MSGHQIVSTFDVEDAYVVAHDPIGIDEEGPLRAAFQAWLREIRARVWDEGFDAGRDDLGAAAVAREHGEDQNPYREA